MTKFVLLDTNGEERAPGTMLKDVFALAERFQSPQVKRLKSVIVLLTTENAYSGAALVKGMDYYEKSLAIYSPALSARIRALGGAVILSMSRSDVEHAHNGADYALLALTSTLNHEAVHLALRSGHDTDDGLCFRLSARFIENLIRFTKPEHFHAVALMVDQRLYELGLDKDHSNTDLTKKIYKEMCKKVGQPCDCGYVICADPDCTTPNCILDLREGGGRQLYNPLNL